MYLHMYMENITCTRKLEAKKNPNFSAHTKNSILQITNYYSLTLPTFPPPPSPPLPPSLPSLPTDTMNVQSRVCAHAV